MSRLRWHRVPLLEIREALLQLSDTLVEALPHRRLIIPQLLNPLIVLPHGA
jgi:hypothetical protein